MESTAKKHLVLTPEGSLNWLFGNSFLTNLWLENYVLIMDRQDFKRHSSLALQSDLAFIKYISLILLRSLRKLQIEDYQTYCTPEQIRTNVSIVHSPFIVRDPFRFEDPAADAYREYKKYVSNKEEVIERLNSGKEKKVLQSEVSAADKALENGFEKEQLIKYIQRLSIKILTAQSVASVFKGEVFDSGQYEVAASILNREGIPIAFNHAVFSDRKEFNDVISIYKSKYGSTGGHLKLPNPILLFLSSKKANVSPQSLVEEISKTDFEVLDEELKDLESEEKRESGSRNRSLDFLCVFADLVKMAGTATAVNLLRKRVEVLCMPTYKAREDYSVASQLIYLMAKCAQAQSNRNDEIKAMKKYFVEPFNKDLIRRENLALNKQRSMDDWVTVDAWFERTFLYD